MTTKKCSKCGEEKALTYFYRSKLGKYGVDARCKKCKIATNIEHRRKSPQKFADAERLRRQKRDDYAKAYDRDYRCENAKTARKNLSNWYVKNVLTGQGWRKEDITPEIIEVKRLEILIKRHIRNGNGE